MSIHKSLKVKGTLIRHRNVLTRAERMEVLGKAGLWKQGQSIYGLPKTRTRKGS